MKTRGRRKQRGGVAIIVAIVLPLLVGMTALGIDAVYYYGEKRSLQSAADLAALAGAIDLPDLPSEAVAAAQDVAAANGYTDGLQETSVTVTTPFEGDPGRVEISIRRSVPTWFGRIFMSSVLIGARAVAERETGEYALFANRSDCGSGEKAIDWSGSIAQVQGEIQSNSGITVGGSDNAVQGSVCYGCDLDLSGSDNSFSSSPEQCPDKPMPAHNCPTSGCTYSRSGDFDLSSSGPWWENGDPNSRRLRPGTYCATGWIKLSASDVQGQVTLSGGAGVDISGSNFNLSAFSEGVLACSLGTGEPAIKLAGSTGTWAGVIYAPDGQVEMSGSSNASLVGSIVADTIKLNGSDWSIRRGADGGRRLALIE